MIIILATVFFSLATSHIRTTQVILDQCGGCGSYSCIYKYNVQICILKTNVVSEIKQYTHLPTSTSTSLYQMVHDMLVVIYLIICDRCSSQHIGETEFKSEFKNWESYMLRYYATFKVRKFESLFYKINACLQKTTTCMDCRQIKYSQ